MSLFEHKSSAFWLFITTGIFLLLRLLFLTSLPIITDESIYMHWGTRFLTSWDDPRMPLSLHGKQAATLLTLGLAQLPPLDPLVAVRISTVIFSFITLIATLWVAKQVLSPSSKLICALLLATSPLYLFFNRLAIPDTAVAASYVLAMALTLKLIKRPNFMTAIFVGLVVAGGWWYKSTALLALPAIVLTFGSRLIIKKKHQTILLVQGSISVLVAILFSLGIIHIPIFNRVVPLEETQHVFTMIQLLSLPWRFWVDNTVKVFEAILLISSPLALFAFTTAFARPHLAKGQGTLWIWFLTPIVFEIILARIFNLRYLILAIPVFTLIVADALQQKQKLSIMIVATSAVLSIFLIVHPIGFYRYLAPLPHVQTDLSQYVTGWASGWGVKEAADFLTQEAKNGPIAVFVRLDGGNPEDAMYVFLRGQLNIVVVPLTRANIEHGRHISGQTYYFVSRGPQYAGLEDKLTEVIRFNKPLGNEFVGIYTFTP